MIFLIFNFLHFDLVQVHPMSFADNGEKPADLCESPIYCYGKLLDVIQMSGVFNDSKDFVDLPMKYDKAEILQRFNDLMNKTQNNASRDDLDTFVKANFEFETEMLNATLTDWTPNPKLISKISDERYKKWVNYLNEFWKTLARRMSEHVRDHPDRHSLIYVNNTFIIPGGRFKEFYYWDTYWVIEGLLQCEMYNTTRGIIENFISIVNTYGFIPNGGRVYYLMRSQPPLLISMVDKYFTETGDWDFVERNLDSLEKEFSYWMKHKSIGFSKDGKNYTLSRYVTLSLGPRPESYKEDLEYAKKLNSSERDAFYNHVKAAAESGWDFSSRWFVGKNGTWTHDFLNISAGDILPVDLNAFIERNARTLAKFFHIKNNTEKSLHYDTIAANYRDAIDALLWNEEDGTWYDFDKKNKQQRKIFYLSNLTPLYTMSYDKSRSYYYGQRSVDYLHKHKIKDYLGGMPTSLSVSEQQWDSANAWAPLQSIVVEGLRGTSYPPAEQLAQSFALNFLQTTYLAFDKYGKMFEKYDTANQGESGGGGEYKAQDGFGWTNGVILQFLNDYPMASSEYMEQKKPRDQIVAIKPRNSSEPQR
ncbi:hypothetical protein QAD02_011637 [Eretmocerus hayati]|uniref:Uncharacterized protein n=1 Tax=Eretmocerus hayati TaxID=131215 RepID=A0ACC2NZ40_9HYME|nr:hypothetical protein QAD02_011637 [Eretmocerus hayati]